MNWRQLIKIYSSDNQNLSTELFTESRRRGKFLKSKRARVFAYFLDVRPEVIHRSFASPKSTVNNFLPSDYSISNTATDFAGRVVRKPLSVIVQAPNGAGLTLSGAAKVL